MSGATGQLQLSFPVAQGSDDRDGNIEHEDARTTKPQSASAVLCVASTAPRDASGSTLQLVMNTPVQLPEQVPRPPSQSQGITNAGFSSTSSSSSSAPVHGHHRPTPLTLAYSTATAAAAVASSGQSEVYSESQSRSQQASAPFLPRLSRHVTGSEERQATASGSTTSSADACTASHDVHMHQDGSQYSPTSVPPSANASAASSSIPYTRPHANTYSHPYYPPNSAYASTTHSSSSFFSREASYPVNPPHSAAPTYVSFSSGSSNAPRQHQDNTPTQPQEQWSTATNDDLSASAEAPHPPSTSASVATVDSIYSPPLPGENRYAHSPGFYDSQAQRYHNAQRSTTHTPGGTAVYLPSAPIPSATEATHDRWPLRSTASSSALESPIEAPTSASYAPPGSANAYHDMPNSAPAGHWTAASRIASPATANSSAQSHWPSAATSSNCSTSHAGNASYHPHQQQYQQSYDQYSYHTTRRTHPGPLYYSPTSSSTSGLATPASAHFANAAYPQSHQNQQQQHQHQQATYEAGGKSYSGFSSGGRWVSPQEYNSRQEEYFAESRHGGAVARVGEPFRQVSGSDDHRSASLSAGLGESNSASLHDSPMAGSSDMSLAPAGFSSGSTVADHDASEASMGIGLGLPFHSALPRSSMVSRGSARPHTKLAIRSATFSHSARRPQLSTHKSSTIGSPTSSSSPHLFGSNSSSSSSSVALQMRSTSESGSSGMDTGALGGNDSAPMSRKNSTGTNLSTSGGSWARGRSITSSGSGGGQYSPMPAVWTGADELALIMVLNETDGRSWTDIARRAFPDTERFTASECQDKWRELSKEKKMLNRGPWTTEEDQTLLEAVQTLRPEKWVVIATQVPHRNGKQCRERWHNHLDPSIKKGQFTSLEDETIFHWYSIVGSKWSEIAKHLPGRPDNMIKNHFNTSLQRQKRRIRNAQLDQQAAAAQAEAEAAGAGGTTTADADNHSFGELTPPSSASFPAFGARSDAFHTQPLINAVEDAFPSGLAATAGFEPGHSGFQDDAFAHHHGSPSSATSFSTQMGQPMPFEPSKSFPVSTSSASFSLPSSFQDRRYTGASHMQNNDRYLSSSREVYYS